MPLRYFEDISSNKTETQTNTVNLVNFQTNTNEINMYNVVVQSTFYINNIHNYNNLETNIKEECEPDIGF